MWLSKCKSRKFKASMLKRICAKTQCTPNCHVICSNEANKTVIYEVIAAEKVHQRHQLWRSSVLTSTMDPPSNGNFAHHHILSWPIRQRATTSQKYVQGNLVARCLSLQSINDQQTTIKNMLENPRCKVTLYTSYLLHPLSIRHTPNLHSASLYKSCGKAKSKKILVGLALFCWSIREGAEGERLVASQWKIKALLIWPAPVHHTEFLIVNNLVIYGSEYYSLDIRAISLNSSGK